MKCIAAVVARIASVPALVLLVSCGGGDSSAPPIAAAPSPTATPVAAPSFPPGDRARGKITYDTICAQCHAINPLQDVKGVLGGAGQPQNILNAIENIARMRFLIDTIGMQDASDIAVHLANP